MNLKRLDIKLWTSREQLKDKFIASLTHYKKKSITFCDNKEFITMNDKLCDKKLIFCNLKHYIT